MCYPYRPNAVTKKKYYEFVQNIPLFLPVQEIATYFGELLDQYPVSPYLDSRDAFIRWTHFIHNKINQRLEKPVVSLSQFYESYYEQYKPNDVKLREYYKLRGKIVYLVLVSLFVGAIFYLYNK
jgi:hypothetical protein